MAGPARAPAGGRDAGGRRRILDRMKYPLALLGAVGAWLCLASVTGCSPPPDPAAEIAPSAAACQRPAQRCRLSDGTVGICEKRPNGGYTCTPQH